jgi:hypothetical protein
MRVHPRNLLTRRRRDSGRRERRRTAVYYGTAVLVVNGPSRGFARVLHRPVHRRSVPAESRNGLSHTITELSFGFRDCSSYPCARINRLCIGLAGPASQQYLHVPMFTTLLQLG